MIMSLMMIMMMVKMMLAIMIGMEGLVALDQTTSNTIVISFNQTASEYIYEYGDDDDGEDDLGDNDWNGGIGRL